MKQIQILGTGCPKCRKLYEMAESVAKEMGIEYQISKVEDINAIMDMGVMMTPAMAVDGTVVVAGKVPKAEEIQRLLAD